MNPLMKVLTGVGDSFSRTAGPTTTVGTRGVQITHGWIVSEERNRRLTGIEKYRTGSEMLLNSSIVAASMKLYLDLISQAQWVFDGEDQAVERATVALMDDPLTPWHRIVRRAAFYLYWGFSVSEWTMQRRPEDGVLTFQDIAPRAQRTIERWDLVDGQIEGIVQRDANTYRELYIPRGKCLYVVDDSMDDSPEGLGLFRHLVERWFRLMAYERLEWSNYEDVALGTLIGLGPYAQLEGLVQSTQHPLTDAGRRALEAPLQTFLDAKVKGEGRRSALALDSSVYEGVTVDNENRPTSARQWGVERVPTETGGLAPIGKGIDRLNMELARVAGTEGLLLGSGEGSYALSEDKSHTLMLRVDSANREIAQAVKNDLLVPLWAINGWDLATIPEVKVEAVRYRDVEKLAKVLKDLAGAGAMLDPQDPAIDDIRDLAGLSSYEPPEEDDVDASLIAGGVGEEMEEEGDE